MKTAIISAIIGAVVSSIISVFPNLYVQRQLIKEQRQFAAQLREKEQKEERQKQRTEAEVKNLEEFTKSLQSLNSALRERDMKAFEAYAKVLNERLERHEFDLILKPHEMGASEDFYNEVQILKVQLEIYLRLFAREKSSGKQTNYPPELLFLESIVGTMSTQAQVKLDIAKQNSEEQAKK